MPALGASLNPIVERQIREMVKRDKLLPAEQVDDVLDLRKMTEIGIPGGGKGPMSAGG